MIEFENKIFKTKESSMEVETEEGATIEIKKTYVTAPNGNEAVFHGESDTWRSSFEYWALKQL